MDAAVPDGVQIVCYADDTLIIVRGKDWTRTLRQMKAAVAAVIDEVHSLGLDIVAQKKKPDAGRKSSYISRVGAYT